jgi:hypothetical protein
MRKISKRAVALFRELRNIEIKNGADRDVWPDGLLDYYCELEAELDGMFGCSVLWGCSSIMRATTTEPPPYIARETCRLETWWIGRKARIALEKKLEELK